MKTHDLMAEVRSLRRRSTTKLPGEVLHEQRKAAARKRVDRDVALRQARAVFAEVRKGELEARQQVRKNEELREDLQPARNAEVIESRNREMSVQLGALKRIMDDLAARSTHRATFEPSALLSTYGPILKHVAPEEFKSILRQAQDAGDATAVRAFASFAKTATENFRPYKAHGLDIMALVEDAKLSIVSEDELVAEYAGEVLESMGDSLELYFSELEKHGRVDDVYFTPDLASGRSALDILTRDSDEDEG